MRAIVHLEDLTDDVRIGTEFRAPIGVTEHEHGFRAMIVVGRHKRAADDRLDAKDVEEVGRHDPSGDAIRLAAPQQVETHLMKFDETFKAGELLAVVVELLDRHTEVRLVGERRRLLHQHEAIAVLVGQRLEQHAVDHAEDGGVGADTEAQRQHGEGGKARVLPQRAGTVAEIGEQFLEPAHTARIPCFFFVLFHWSKIPDRQLPRLVGRHPSADVLLRFHLKVKLHFGVELTVHARAVSHRPCFMCHPLEEHCSVPIRDSEALGSRC